MPGTSSTRLVNLELVDTCTPYETAPLEAPHSNIGVKSGTVEPLDGDCSVGGDGGGGSVVAEVSTQ